MVDPRNSNQHDNRYIFIFLRKKLLERLGLAILMNNQNRFRKLPVSERYYDKRSNFYTMRRENNEGAHLENSDRHFILVDRS